MLSEEKAALPETLLPSFSNHTLTQESIEARVFLARVTVLIEVSSTQAVKSTFENLTTHAIGT